MWLPELRPTFSAGNWTPQEIYYAKRLLSQHIPNRNHFLWDFKVRVLRSLLAGSPRVNPLSVDQWATLSKLYYLDYLDVLTQDQDPK